MARSRRSLRAGAPTVRARFHPLQGRLEAGRQQGPTLALAIGRRAGKATVRSRAKRILREAFREAVPRLPEEVRVVIAADGDLTQTPRRAVRQAAANLLESLLERWNTSHPSQGPSAKRSWRSSGSTS